MASMNCTIRLAILAIVHVVCGLVLGYFAEDGPPNFFLAFYLGLFFSQTSLLGIWGGLANTAWPLRLAGVALGMTYLGPQMCFSLNEWGFEIFLLVFLTTVAVAGVMLVVRRFKARLARNAKGSLSTGLEGLQFSIRHLMLLTLVVACTLAIGKWLQPYFSSVQRMAYLLTISLCFVSVGVTSVWASLGRAHLLPRCGGVFSIGLLTASIPTYLFERGDVWFWTAMMITEVMVLLVSLLVVRRCGFRLVRVSRRIK